MKYFLSRFPLHPILFSAYPALALIAANINEVNLLIGLRSLFLSITFVSTFFLIACVLLRQCQIAALVSSLFAILFFSYGHVHLFILDQGWTLLERQRVIIGLYLLLFLVGTYLFIRKVKNLQDLTLIFNITACVLMIYPLVIIGQAYLAVYFRDIEKKRSTSDLPISDSILPLDAQDQSLKTNNNPPDIYFIILDSYTRKDYLFEDYQLDNSEFIDDLVRLGFQVADCSRSNYDGTRLSLSATLNMEFVENLNEKFNPANLNIYSIEPYMKQNKVFRILRNLRYQIVAVQSIFPVTSFTTADVYIPFPRSSWWNGSLNEFEDIFFNTTLMKITQALPGKTIKEIREKFRFPYNDYVENINFVIDDIPNIASLPGPKMVFIHITIPHRPYIFLPDGSFTTDEAFCNFNGLPVDLEHAIQGYRNNVEFINMRILPKLEEIIKQSKGNAIIILQGDHGFRDQNRNAILNAIYLPDYSTYEIPEDMTSINTFRVIFNEFFKGKYTYLEDRSFSVENATPFLFTELEEKSPYCQP